MASLINQTIKKIINTLVSRKGYRLAAIKKEGPTGVDLEYDLQMLITKEAAICLDVGANVGQTIEDFSSWLKRPIIHSFEPSTPIFSILQKKKDQQGTNWSNVHLYPYALGDSEGKSELTNYKNNLLSSLLELEDTPDNPFLGDKDKISQKETVKVGTVDQFLLEQNINSLDILKIDTQGFDLNVLKGAEQSLKEGKIKYIFLEMNFVPMYKGQGNATTLIDYLEQFDQKVIGFYDIYRPPEGVNIAWCSTLFGRH